MTVYPNVKLNLGLRVLGKRPDGYHELQTAFVPCYAFSDCLEIVPASGFEIDVFGPEYSGWDPSEDLSARAWRLLRADFGIPPVRISLEKRSPVGAGLGGGSADGAFALAALNEMFSLGLPKERLAEYAAQLGSDCAFFVYNFPMFGSGRGEVLEPLRLPLDGYRFEVAVPEGVHVSTREAYEGLRCQNGAKMLHPPGEKGGGCDENGQKCDRPPVDLRTILTETPIERWKDVVVNDFEASVFKTYPAIAELKEEFYRKGAVYAAMSGSGSAVFGIFRDKATKEDAR
ncbi:MAG: 4-(cytidine 5'-diphospho)-2-C-methyl-D-erythritol kinase [Bacteroidales bacterium]|nr:4-(cytidine 5'-diphospho)-2-C-methyl-D-erythritol kinase [Bacteroidales bacterium]